MYKYVSSLSSFKVKCNKKHLFLCKTVHTVNDNVTKNCKHFNEIPGPKSYPVIGALYNYLPLIGVYKAEALHKNAWFNWKRYGPLVRESLLPSMSLLHVFDPEDIEAVFRQEGRIPARRSHLAMKHYRLRKSDVYNTGGLLATNGPEWWRLRSTFQKNFSSPKSVQFYVTHTDLVVKQFMSWIKCKQPIESDFLCFLNRLNLEVIGEIAFGEKFNSFSEDELKPGSKTSKVIKSAFDSNSGIFKLDKGFWWKIFNTPLYKRLAKAQTVLEEVSKGILLKKARYFEEKQPQAEAQSLVDSFLQQPNLDLKDVTGMMVDILMAAVDTTSYTSSFALYYLSLYPKCQEELYKEACSLLPELDTNITPEIISKANYVRNCIKETLRLNPVSIGIGRVLQKDIVLRGYRIPENPLRTRPPLLEMGLPEHISGEFGLHSPRWPDGLAYDVIFYDNSLTIPQTVIITQNMLASRLPQYVKDPLKFNPKRWQRDSDAYENLNPFLSLPFGFGPRSCIARRLAEQNVAITLLRLVREYEFKWNGGELGIQTHLINKPDKPILLSLVPRSK